VIALFAGLAMAQGFLDGDPLEDCAPRVIAGTPGVAVTQQATRTNAQIYGAVALAEDTLLPLDGVPVSFRASNIYNVNRLPTVAACRYGQRYGMAAMDMFATSAGAAIPFKVGEEGELRIVYAGSITGTLMHFPSHTWANNRVFSSEAMAFAGIGLGYAPFLAPLIDRESGPQTVAADGMLGLQFFNPWDPELGALSLGYVYSSGLYSNVSVAKLKVLASALLTQELSELAMAKLGFYGIVAAEVLGRSHLYVRRKLIEPPTADQTVAPQQQITLLAPRVDLHTVHYEQRNIGGWVDIDVTGAMTPRVFLHEGWLGVHDPTHMVDVRVGVTELPALPWYGIDGGRKLSYDIRAVYGFVSLSRNDADTLTNFPYAQDAIHLQFGVSSEAIQALRDARNP